MAEYEEKSLVYELKKLCYENGKEKHPKDSAKILHKLGVMYKRKSLDRLSLLQSVALMTSATTREPDNIEEIKQSLNEVCTHLLHLAGGRSSPQSLDDIVSDLKKQLQSIRNDTIEKLSAVEKISYEAESGNNDVEGLEAKKIKEINDLQIVITDKYTKFMSCICEHCVDIMDEPPCKYALVGLGSLARKEVTPYSDFESIIVLEEDVQNSDNYHDVLEYFRWLSTIFQMILIRLGETILRFMAIPCLNDPLDPENNWFYDAYTPCGICPDGFAPAACKNPLGRQTPTLRKPWTTELIKPVSEMLKYLDTEEDLKNGYHLADILMKTCFVSGNKDVFESFENLIFEKRNFQLLYERKETLQRISNQLSENFDWYDKLSESLSYKESLDLKRYFYRGSTLFISALGSLYGLKESSCQEMVEKLHTMEIITTADCHKLMLCVAVSCEFRLRFYCHSKGQNDFVSRRYFKDQMCGVFDDILQSIGIRAVVSCVADAILFREYLLIVKDNIPEMMFQKQTFDLLPDIPLIRAEVCLIFGIFDVPFSDWLEKCEKDHTSMTYSKTEGFSLRYFFIRMKWLHSTGYGKEVRMEFFLKISGKQNSISPIWMFLFYDLLANSLKNCRKYKSALKYFRKMNYLVFSKKIQMDSFRLKKLFCDTGQCFEEMGRHSKAIAYFKKGLKDVAQLEDILKVSTNYELLCRMCSCLREVKKHSEANDVMQKLLDCRKMVTDEDTYDIWTAKCLYDFAHHLCESGNPQKALDICERAWNQEDDESSTKFHYLYIKSFSLLQLHRHEEAYSCFQDLMFCIKHLRRSDKFKTNHDPNLVTSVYFARFAKCAVALGRYKEAVDYSKKALWSHQQTKLKSVSDIWREQDLRYAIVDYTFGFVLHEERNDTLSTNKEETTQAQINTDAQSLLLFGYRAFANKDYVMAVNHFQMAFDSLPSPPATVAPKRRCRIEKKILRQNSCQFVTDSYRLFISLALQHLGRNREALAQSRQAWREALMLGWTECGKRRKILTLQQLLFVPLMTGRSAEQFRAAEFAVTFAQELSVDISQILTIDIFRLYLSYCLQYLPKCKLVAYAYTPSLYYHAMREIPALKDNPDICYELWPIIRMRYFAYRPPLL